MEFSVQDAAAGDSNILGGGEGLIPDATMDASPEAPDGTPTDAGPHDLLLVDYQPGSVPGFNTIPVDGPALFVEYKCCLDETSCEVEIQGDGSLCQDLGAWMGFAVQSCSSRGETVTGLALYMSC